DAPDPAPRRRGRRDGTVRAALLRHVRVDDARGDGRGGIAPMKCVVRAGPPSAHALGLAAAGVSLLLAAAVLPLDGPPFSLFACPFQAATSLPCLSCGCTRAFAAAVRLHPLQALRANPLGALAAGAFA